jgi:hypothetical protein
LLLSFTWYKLFLEQSFASLAGAIAYIFGFTLGRHFMDGREFSSLLLDCPRLNLFSVRWRLLPLSVCSFVFSFRFWGALVPKSGERFLYRNPAFCITIYLHLAFHWPKGGEDSW